MHHIDIGGTVENVSSLKINIIRPYYTIMVKLILSFNGNVLAFYFEIIYNRYVILYSTHINIVCVKLELSDHKII